MVEAVPFFRPSIGELEIEAVISTLRSGWLTTGPVTKAFEEEFCAALGDKKLHAVAVNSATAALHLGLEAMGIGPGDEVIVPTLTFTATAEVVRYLGATPVLVDIDAETLCLDPELTEKAITSATKAIMPVHFAGRPCNMTRFREIADRHGLSILDDAAHALPASHQNVPVGAGFSEATAFSFYANKTMTTGEGGMLVTRDPEIAKRARIMRLHGIDRDIFNRFTDQKASYHYDVVAPGFKYNLTDLAAAIGRVQLRRLDEFHQRRCALKAAYVERLADLPLILPPDAAQDDIHSWHLFIIQLGEGAGLKRDALARELQARNVGVSVHYRPLHQMTYWKGMTSDNFSISDTYYKGCLTLPLFMDMREEEVDYVASVLKEVLYR